MNSLFSGIAFETLFDWKESAGKIDSTAFSSSTHFSEQQTPLDPSHQQSKQTLTNQETIFTRKKDLLTNISSLTLVYLFQPLTCHLLSSKEFSKSKSCWVLGIYSAVFWGFVQQKVSFEVFLPFLKTYSSVSHKTAA